MGKNDAVRLVWGIVSAMIVQCAAAGADWVEHPNVLKNFHWPTPIKIHHFVYFTEAAPLGLNLFEVPENSEGAAVRWRDGMTVRLSRTPQGWQVERGTPEAMASCARLPAGKVEIAVDGRGVTFRTGEKELRRVEGGLDPNDLLLLLPGSAAVPEVKSIYVMDDILLYLCADEAEKRLEQASNLFDSQKKVVTASPVYQGNRYTWQVNGPLHKNAIARVKAEVEQKLQGFLPALLSDPLVRDRCNWVFYIGMRQGPITGGYFSGGFYRIWFDKMLGRGEIVSAMLFADMLEDLVAQSRRLAGTAFAEGAGVRGLLAAGLVSPLTRVPRRAGLPAELRRRAELRCARGEAESVQLVLTSAGKEVGEIGVKLVPQTPDAPEAVLERIEWIHLVPAGTMQIPMNRGGDIAEGDVCLPVRPDEKFTLPQYTNQAFLVTVRTLNSTLPGEYRYQIEVSAAGRKVAALPVKVKVEQFALQDRIPGLPGLRPGNIAQFYPDPKIAAAARRNLMEAMLKHRMEPLDLYRQSPLAEDLDWALAHGLRSVLLDGRMERLADPREEMPDYIELYGSTDGKKFERIPATVELDRRDPDDPLSPTDLVVTPGQSTRQYRYCKLHYSQPTYPFDRFQIHFFEVMGKGGKTMQVNGKEFVPELRLLRPDRDVTTGGMDRAESVKWIKFDLLNNKLHSPSLLWENRAGDIQTLRLYNHLRGKILAELKPFYEKVMAATDGSITCYLYGFDEKERHFNKPMLSAVKNARLAFPKVKLVTTATNPEAAPELFRYLDIHCRGNGKSDVRLNRQTAQKYGTEYWTYVGGGSYYPFASFERADQPRINSRAFFWSMIAFDHIRGWLYWAINYWGGNDPFRASAEPDWSLWQCNHGSFNGMRAIFYPGKNGEIYPSVRASAMRDGLEDAELFRIARTLVKTPEDKAELEAVRKGFAVGMSVFCQDIKALERCRSRLYDLLAKLVRPVRVTELDFRNFQYEKNTLFHPAVTVLKDGRWLAITQEVKNSDLYGEPVYTISSDQGKSWSPLSPVPSLGYRQLKDCKFTEAVADNRPFTLQDGSVVVFGCKTHYYGQKRADADPENRPLIPAQYTYYTIWSPASGRWTDRAKLELPGLKHYRAACTQALPVGDDQIIVPHYLSADQEQGDFGPPKRFGVLTALFRLVDGKLVFVRRSRIMSNPVKRGLIEPSIVRLPDRSFALTIRAEDGKMYCAFSKDGIDWSEPEPWCWEDGSPIRTASTQQHWLTLGDRVFLVYTRYDGSNFPLPYRYRGPLYLAEVVPGKARLIRTSEKVVFPRKNRNGLEARYGNFHCTQLGRDVALITDTAYFSRIVGPRQHSDIRSDVVAALVTAE